MKGHFTYIGNLVEDPNWQKFSTAIILGGLILLFGLYSRFVKKQINNEEDLSKSLTLCSKCIRKKKHYAHIE